MDHFFLDLPESCPDNIITAVEIPPTELGEDVEVFGCQTRWTGRPDEFKSAFLERQPSPRWAGALRSVGADLQLSIIWNRNTSKLSA